MAIADWETRLSGVEQLLGWEEMVVACGTYVSVNLLHGLVCVNILADFEY